MCFLYYIEIRRNVFRFLYKCVGDIPNINLNMKFRIYSKNNTYSPFSARSARHEKYDFEFEEFTRLFLDNLLDGEHITEILPENLRLHPSRE